MLNLADIERGLREMEAHYQAQAERGLRAAAPGVQDAMQTTTQHGDITGATRAGYRAAVITPADNGASVLAGAVRDVEALNAGESATSSGTLDGEVGMVLYSPTTYQEDLESENAGRKSVLGPTLASVADDLTRRAAEGR